jgi:hypothetical protein
MTRTKDNRQLRERAKRARKLGVPPSAAGASLGAGSQQHHRTRDDHRPDRTDRAREQLERPDDNPHGTRPGSQAEFGSST